ncbi:MAG: SGNH/GDSL hydrolase family protein [Spirochaetales bacterium]|nr:SGNH/GDSL hydrolase family protein [Spirochaetales bacterium]
MGSNSLQGKQSDWIVTWGAAQQLTEPNNLPPPPGLKYSTLRQVIHVSTGGSRLRFKFSNLFSIDPVVIEAVHVAVSKGGSSIDSQSDTALTFQGASSITIPPRGEIYSDPFDFNVKPLSELAVSIYFFELNNRAITGHPGSRTTSYIISGDAVSDPEMSGATRVEHWYILAGLEAASPPGRATLVIVGDSITDGRGSTTNKNNRWPDQLARRMQADEKTADIGIYNAGIGGNAVLRGGLGPSLLTRVQRDVIDQQGVKWLIVMEGVNDIGGVSGKAAADNVAKQLIEAYESIITMAHKASINVYGATITPFGGSFYDSPEREQARQTVNEWIRTGKKFDAVIDMDQAVRDPKNPSRLLKKADSGDHLHLSPEGYRLMADAVDLSLFQN